MPGVLVPPNDKSVAKHTYNPMLKGVRERNRRKSRRVNSTGKYQSVKAEPEELLQRLVPHLAFFEEGYYDRVVAKVKKSNVHCRRADDPRSDPCRNRPRRRSRYPGHVAFCEICGRQYVWGAHGQTNHMMCSGRKHRCWNGISFDGPMAAKKFAAAAYEAVEVLEGFDPAFLAIVREEADRLDGDRMHRIENLRVQLTAAERIVDNFANYVKGGDDSPTIREKLRSAEHEVARLTAVRADAEREPTHRVEIPDLAALPSRSPTNVFAILWSTPRSSRRSCVRIAPRISVFPVRLCDGGQVVLRACVTLQLTELLEDSRARMYSVVPCIAK